MKSFSFGLSPADVDLAELCDQSFVSVHVCWLNFVSLFMSKSQCLDSGASIDATTDKSLSKQTIFIFQLVLERITLSYSVRYVDYLTICLRVLLGSEESKQANERYLLSIHKYDLCP